MVFKNETNWVNSGVEKYWTERQPLQGEVEEWPELAPRGRALAVEGPHPRAVHFAHGAAGQPRVPQCHLGHHGGEARGEVVVALWADGALGPPVPRLARPVFVAGARREPGPLGHKGVEGRRKRRKRMRGAGGTREKACQA